MATSTSRTPRRTSRQKKPSLKALESLYISKLKTSGFVADPSTSDEENLLDFLSEGSDIEIEKPKMLNENVKVHGDCIFSFQSNKQRNSLAQKVVEACNQDTPLVLRSKIKSKITDSILNYSSGSDYECPTTSESSSEEESSSSESNSGSDDDVRELEKNSASAVSVSQDKPIPKNNKPRVNGKYTIQSDEYFANYSTNKIKTSNNTLDKLETPRLPQYELQKIISKMQLSREHGNAISNLEKFNKINYKKWIYLLHENFNILLYGLGSKRNLINNFHKEYLKDSPVIVVNGFFPSVSIKNILDAILVNLLEFKETPNNLNEACDLIMREFSLFPKKHLYLLIHNIEGDSLKNCKTQNILPKLASQKNIHLIVSIDHINAPLIWDHRRLSLFNFVWYDVTTYLTYMEETSNERSMMVQQSGTLALSSLKNVFVSLTTNSKAIYLKIVKHQLDNMCQYYQGISFKDLYMACRESFIASTDLALRAQLTEFIDHKMLKLKRSADGTEYLNIPLANSLLQTFYEANT